MSGRGWGGTAVSGWREGAFATRHILAGLIVLICVACIPSVAGADVDMTGKIAPGPAPSLRSPGLGAPTSLRGATLASGTNPVVVRNSNTTQQWVLYTSSKDIVEVAYFHPGVGWEKPAAISSAVAPGTSPAVEYNAGTGQMWALYTSSSDITEVAYFHPGVGWEKPAAISYAVMPGTSPAVVYNPSTGAQWIYVSGGNDGIESLRLFRK